MTTRLLGQSVEQFSIFRVNIPAINIRKIEQDERQFMWIGSQDGLFRYDSRHFTEYNTGKRPAHAIYSPDVRAMVQDTLSNCIWVATTEGGICQVDINTGIVVFTLSKTDVPQWGTSVITSMHVVADKLYVASGAGLFIIDKSTKRTVPFFSLASVITDVENMVAHDNALVLFCRNRGVIVVDAIGKRIVDSIPEHRIVNTPTSNSYLRFYEIASLGNGEWLSATSDGLKLFKFGSNRAHVDPKPYAYVPLTYTREIFAVVKDQSGAIWFSTGNELVKIIPGKRSYSLIREASAGKDNDWLDNAYYLFCDRNNDIWMGCQKGLAYLVNEQPAFSTYHRSANSGVTIKHAYFLYPFTDSILYATAEDGLYKINLISKDIDAIDQSQAYDYIFADPNSRMIASNRKGLFVLERNRLKNIGKYYPEFKLFESYKINSAIKLNDSCIVMGTENYSGILVWNFIEHIVYNYNEHTFPIKLAEGNVNGLYLLSKNRFCVLSDNSFLIIDYNTKKVESVHLKEKDSRKEFSLYFDMCRLKEHYYIASYGAGVLVLNKQMELIKTITTRDGLSNNGVYKVLPWKDSLLFVTTNKGLNMFNPVKEIINVFYKSHGLHDNTFEETGGSVYNGIIFAGGPNGITTLNPTYISRNNNSPEFYFNKLSLEMPGNKRIDTSNLSASSFTIPSNTLQTTVYFSGMNYRNADLTTFAYKIVELHRDWIMLGNQDFINLIGTSAVTYHLQVKVANEDGVWSDPRELTLIFLPKWYETWWFNLVLGLAAVGTGYFIYRVRISQLRKEHEIRSKLASDLHDDLGSTLNSVKVYANLAIDDKRSDTYLLKVKESVQEGITGLRDMIWVLDDEMQSIEHLITRVSSFAIPMCEANKIVFKQAMTDDARDYKLRRDERQNLYMILKEVINNAIKYSAGSKIEIRIFLKKGKPHLEITDDGIGFDADKAAGGYGLKNMVSRCKKIKYLIQIKSDLGSGTRVFLQKL